MNDKQALVDLVIEQILIDVERKDLTAIEELLMKVDSWSLQGYLSDDPTLYTTYTRI